MVYEVRCEEVLNDPIIAVHNDHYHRSGMDYGWHLSEPMSNKNQLRNPDESEIYSSIIVLVGAVGFMVWFFASGAAIPNG